MREPLSPNPYLRRRSGAGKALLVGAGVAAVAVLTALATYTLLRLRDSPGPAAASGTAETAAPAEAPAAEPTAGAAAREPPQIPSLREPSGDTAAIPLPELDASDGDVRSALTELAGAEAIETWLKPEQIVRNTVVTIDNLPRVALDQEQRPLEPAPGALATGPSEDAPMLTAENFERYRGFVERVAELDAAALVRLYAHYRPLFNEAYRDLGYPEGDFDVRLVEVIDHMLDAPAVEPPIPLARPEVMYEYADESLEQRSAGHKLMIRMGPNNAAVIKDKLRELREALTGRAGRAGASD